MESQWQRSSSVGDKNSTERSRPLCETVSCCCLKMKRGTSVRESVRSRGSSTSTTETDPRQKLQDCCRKLVAFMCTQVGVGGLIVAYAILGAVIFKHIEGKNQEVSISESVNETRYSCALQLWELTAVENTFNSTSWKYRANLVVEKFQKNITDAVKKGYPSSKPEEKWTFSASLMFSLSVFTMLGYGNMVPSTSWGKLVTVVYAVVGIPLYALYFMNMGKVLAQVFRWVYTKIYIYSVENHRSKRSEGETIIMTTPRIIVPPTACLWVMVAYISGGSAMFSAWEEWSYLDSAYFCVTSLCKIGFGDFVPGKRDGDTKAKQSKLVINFVYILLGMGLMAMCYNLMRELVHVKIREFKESISICFELIRLRAVTCYRRRRSLD